MAEPGGWGERLPTTTAAGGAMACEMAKIARSASTASDGSRELISMWGGRPCNRADRQRRLRGSSAPCFLIKASRRATSPSRAMARASAAWVEEAV
eukprot:scaffold32566_cov75-Isochrysis_galbana.AAC.1